MAHDLDINGSTQTMQVSPLLSRTEYTPVNVTSRSENNDRARKRLKRCPNACVECRRRKAKASQCLVARRIMGLSGLPIVQPADSMFGFVLFISFGRDDVNSSAKFAECIKRDEAHLCYGAMPVADGREALESLSYIPASISSLNALAERVRALEESLGGVKRAATPGGSQCSDNIGGSTKNGRPAQESVRADSGLITPAEANLEDSEANPRSSHAL